MWPGVHMVCALKECPLRQETGKLWHLEGAGKSTGCGQEPIGLKMSGDSGRMVSMALNTWGGELRCKRQSFNLHLPISRAVEYLLKFVSLSTFFF